MICLNNNILYVVINIEKYILCDLEYPSKCYSWADLTNNSVEV